MSNGGGGETPAVVVSEDPRGDLVHSLGSSHGVEGEGEGPARAATPVGNRRLSRSFALPDCHSVWWAW